MRTNVRKKMKPMCFAREGKTETIPGNPDKQIRNLLLWAFWF